MIYNYVGWGCAVFILLAGLLLIYSKVPVDEKYGKLGLILGMSRICLLFFIAGGSLLLRSHLDSEISLWAILFVTLGAWVIHKGISELVYIKMFGKAEERK